MDKKSTSLPTLLVTCHQKKTFLFYSGNQAQLHPCAILAVHNQHAVAKMLIREYGLQIHSGGNKVPPPLHLAIKNDHMRMVKLLTTHGASPTASFDGITAVDLARALKSSAVRFLLPPEPANSKTLLEDHIQAAITMQDSPPQVRNRKPQNLRVCYNCGEKEEHIGQFLVCTRCKMSVYCSKKCQKRYQEYDCTSNLPSHWSSGHRKECCTTAPTPRPPAFVEDAPENPWLPCGAFAFLQSLGISFGR